MKESFFLGMCDFYSWDPQDTIWFSVPLGIAIIPVLLLPFLFRFHEGKELLTVRESIPVHMPHMMAMGFFYPMGQILDHHGDALRLTAASIGSPRRTRTHPRLGGRLSTPLFAKGSPLAAVVCLPGPDGTPGATKTTETIQVGDKSSTRTVC